MLEQIVLEGEGSSLPHAFGGYLFNHNLDKIEPEQFVNTSREGKISYYSRKRGFGFIEEGKESYFFHFRGHARLKHVFYENTHKILFLAKEVCDSEVPKIDYPVRFILKKIPDSPQGAQARMWVLAEEYEELVKGIKISGHKDYKVTLGRKTPDGQRMDLLVLFQGNNLTELRERLLFLAEEIKTEGTELLFEEFKDGSWHGCENPVKEDDNGTK